MNMKIAVYGLCAIVLLMAMSVSAQPTADSFGVHNASGAPGTSVIVPVNITNTSTDTILGIGFNIAYDKAVINVTNVSSGELTSDWNVLGFNNEFDWGTRVALAGASAYAISKGTSNSVALLNFAVVATSDSKSYSYMTVTEIQLSDPNGSFGTAPAINGLFQVTGLPTPTPHRGGGGGGGIVTGIEQMPGITHVSNASNKTPTTTVTATITPAATPTLTPVSVAPKQTYRLLILLILALIVIVIYYYYRKRKQA